MLDYNDTLVYPKQLNLQRWHYEVIRIQLQVFQIDGTTHLSKF